MRKSVTLLGYVILVGALLFSSCGKKGGGGVIIDDPDPSTFLPVNLSFGVVAMVTKVTENSFEAGDEIGLYMSYGALQNMGNHVDNKKYSMRSGAWQSDGEIFWEDDTTPADFYAYGPYGNPSYVAEYEFAVKEDQSSVAQYKASDFLWGRLTNVKPSSDLIAMSLSHIMSSFIIELKAGEGFTAEEFAAASKTVTICGMKNTARIDLSTGSVIAAGDITPIQPYFDGNDFKAIVVPQETSSTTPLLNITVAGVSFTLSQNISFQTKTQHKLSVQVAKTLTGITFTIDGWNVDPNDYSGIAK